MKRLSVVILLFCLIGVYRLCAQDSISENLQYYWFYLKLDEVIDNEYKISRMIIKKVDKKIESGSFQNFVSNHKAGLKSGKIYIGPFGSKSQAQNAKDEYDKIQSQTIYSDLQQSKTNMDSAYYYYLARPVIEKWFGKVEFRRIPAKVSQGSMNEFKLALGDGLSSHLLTIGPFPDFEIAEKSKFIFRKNGEAIESISPDTLFKSGMLEMNRKWKSIKIELTKFQSKKNAVKVQYKLKFSFPEKYFSQDVFQTISIKADYDTKIQPLKTGLTFQGERVADNNPVISFEKGSTIQQTLEFPLIKNAKILGFKIESFIYNNTDMVEQELRYLPAK